MTSHELAEKLLKLENITVGIECHKLNGIPDYIDISDVSQYNLSTLREGSTEKEYDSVKFILLEI